MPLLDGKANAGMLNRDREAFLGELRDHLMEPRPDWNARGPYIGQTFRERLVELDPHFVLQFFPPDPLLRPQFSQGFWAVCMRLNQSRLIYKKAVMDLYDPLTNQFVQPGSKHLESLRRVKIDAFRQGTFGSIDEMDRQMAQDERLAQKYCRDRRSNEIDAGLSRAGVTKKSLGKTMVFT